MTKDPSEMRPKEFKYKFQFNSSKRTIESNDSKIWIKRWKVTREQVHLYDLYYHEEVILFSAYSPVRDECPDAVNWELQHVGRGWGNEHESYSFKGPISRKEVVEIIIEFLWQYNGSSNKGKSKVKSVSKANYLQELLVEEEV